MLELFLSLVVQKLYEKEWLTRRSFDAKTRGTVRVNIPTESAIGKKPVL